MAKMGMSEEEWHYYHSREEEAKYDPTDPKQNHVKHVYVHHDKNECNNTNNSILQQRIDQAISKIMDMTIVESDKKKLIKILTGSMN